MIEMFVYIFYIVVVAFLIIKLIAERRKANSLRVSLVQAYIDKQIYFDKLAEEIQKRENANVENTEGFLNFVSQSRDWAYEYIEDVQKELTRVFSAIDTMEKKTPKTILAELDKLKNFLPEEKENNK